MNLEEIIDKIRKNLEEQDKIKLNAIERSRDIIRFSGRAISSAVREEFEEALEAVSQAEKILREIEKTIINFPNLYYSNIMLNAYQEFVEAKALISILMDKRFPSPEELKVNYIPYVLGLGDLSGELRRYALECIRNNELEKAEYALKVMEELYLALSHLEDPKSLVQGLRRKGDITRGVLEKTRGDLTNAFGRDKLIKEIERLYSKINKVEGDNLG